VLLNGMQDHLPEAEWRQAKEEALKLVRLRSHR
jgi:hypothetical protein